MRRNVVNVMVGVFVAMVFGLVGCGGGGDSGGGSSTAAPEAAAPADFTGNWSGTYSGTTLSYIITQTGNNISMTRISPPPTSTAAGITYSGTISGNTAVVNTYGNGTYMATATWTKLTSTTMTAVIDSCNPIQGFTCGAPGTVFTVNKQLYSISGRVTVNGAALAGVAVSTGSNSATTDSSGNYTITSLDSGSYSVTPTLSSYTFTPISQTVAVNGANMYVQDFSAATYSLSGTVSIGGVGLSGVAVALNGSGTTTTITDNSGNFGFGSVQDGSYTLTISKPGYIFTSASQTVTVNGANLTGQNFTGNNTFTVTPSTSVNGSISPSTAQTVISGMTTQFTITPRNGFSIASVTGCNGSLSGNSYTTGNISGACTVTASFSFITTGASIADPTTGMVLVKVAGGTYTMGDTFGDGANDELPTHQVTVGDFYIGKYEVTRSEWQAVVGFTPPEAYTCGANCPVGDVSWTDILSFITTLNKKSGTNYRLPTEAEWEYAARSGGKNEKFSGSSDISAVAWYSGNSGGTSHPGGQKQANGLGLYDMSGNVGEWVNDWYGAYSSSAQTNPTGPTSGNTRVYRGGSSVNDSTFGRASDRSSTATGDRVFFIGFRLVAPVQ